MARKDARRVRVGPGGARRSPARTDDGEVDRCPLPLANAGPRRSDEGARADVAGRPIVDRRMAGFEHAVAGRGVRYQDAIEHDAQPHRRRLKPRRARVGPDALLAGSDGREGVRAAHRCCGTGSKKNGRRSGLLGRDEPSIVHEAMASIVLDEGVVPACRTQPRPNSAVCALLKWLLASAWN